MTYDALAFHVIVFDLIYATKSCLNVNVLRYILKV